MRKATVEALVQCGPKSQLGLAERSAAITVRISVDHRVEGLTIVGDHIFDIGHVLETSLDLERGDTGGHHLLQAIVLRHVTQREQVLASKQDSSPAVNQIIGQAAQLCTLATVGTASLEHLADGTTATIAHAQGSVRKRLERHRGHLPDCGNLIQRELTCHDQLRETQRLEKTGFVGCAQVALRAGMQRDGRQVQPE